MGITREVLPQSESLCPYRSSDTITFTLQNAHLVPPSDGHDTTGEVDPSAHGFGPVEVSLAGFPSTGLDDRVIHTSQLIGGRFSYNQDLNAGNFVGIGVFPTVYRGTLIQSSFSRTYTVFNWPWGTEQFSSCIPGSAYRLWISPKSLGLNQFSGHEVNPHGYSQW